MNNEHYLIHKDDYVKHIDEKVMLYSFVKQLCHHVTKMKMTPENGHICKMAKHFFIEADKMFDSWGIPGSYLVFGDESDLAELMENELIAPEDAGYHPDLLLHGQVRCRYNQHQLRGLQHQYERVYRQRSRSRTRTHGTRR